MFNVAGQSYRDGNFKDEAARDDRRAGVRRTRPRWQADQATARDRRRQSRSSASILAPGTTHSADVRERAETSPPRSMGFALSSRDGEIRSDRSRRRWLEHSVVELPWNVLRGALGPSDGSAGAASNVPSALAVLRHAQLYLRCSRGARGRVRRARAPRDPSRPALPGRDHDHAVPVRHRAPRLAHRRAHHRSDRGVRVGRQHARAAAARSPGRADRRSRRRDPRLARPLRPRRSPRSRSTSPRCARTSSPRSPMRTAVAPELLLALVDLGDAPGRTIELALEHARRRRHHRSRTHGGSRISRALRRSHARSCGRGSTPRCHPSHPPRCARSSASCGHPRSIVPSSRRSSTMPRSCSPARSLVLVRAGRPQRHAALAGLERRPGRHHPGRHHGARPTQARGGHRRRRPR